MATIQMNSQILLSPKKKTISFTTSLLKSVLKVKITPIKVKITPIYSFLLHQKLFTYASELILMSIHKYFS